MTPRQQKWAAKILRGVSRDPCVTQDLRIGARQLLGELRDGSVFDTCAVCRHGFGEHEERVWNTDTGESAHTYCEQAFYRKQGVRREAEEGRALVRQKATNDLDPATIAERVEAICEAFASVDATVVHGDARKALVDGDEVFAYLDPPYVGATGYGWDCPRDEVLSLAAEFANVGAVVAVSEAEPLELPGWHHLELTRSGKPEWLTLSRAPVRVPARQLSLWGGCRQALVGPAEEAPL